MSTKTHLKIVYEDEDILIVDKESGVPVHPSRRHQGDSLADEVKAYYGDDFIFRCINRLDKDTSGLVVVAKNLHSARELNKLMAEGKIKRQYQAVIKDKGEMPDSGTIDAPIGRASENVRDITRTVRKDGERAITHYKVVDRTGEYALVEFDLETGRTHQIRVHMKHLGYPIEGDPIYNPEVTDYDKNPEKMQLRAVKITINGVEYKGENLKKSNQDLIECTQKNYTYIVECSDGTYYCGWTNDLQKRVDTHNSGRGSKYTRSRLPVKLVYYETFDTKEKAMRREWEIKQLSRKEKQDLFCVRRQ